MTTNEETRRLQATGKDDLRTEVVVSSISRIGHTVDAILEDLLWRLVSAELSLTDLTPALQDWWVVAAAEGRKSASRDEIERLTWERDYWFWRYCNPGKDYYAAQTDALWQVSA